MLDVDHRIAEDLLREALLGDYLRSLDTPVAGVWHFLFSEKHLNVSVPWRIIDVEGIRLGSCDHDHKFGLPEPINAVAIAVELLGSRRVNSVSLALKTADLEIAFEGDILLNVFNHSSGWEGWNMFSGSGTHIIALGGGDIAIFAPK
jgi:hypothetical protein